MIANISSELGDLQGMCSDEMGNFFIADYGNNMIQKLNRVDGKWIVSVFAGTGDEGIFDSSSLESTFSGPQSVIYDTVDDSLYVRCDNDIRRISKEGKRFLHW